MFALLTLGFDPTLRAGPFTTRWETLGLAAALFLSLVALAWASRADARRTNLAPLRLDDLFFLVLAGVAGAVIGGRLVEGLDYRAYYGAHPAALLDPSQGTLSLLGAVVGGTLAATYLCRLLEVPARRWLDAASVPLLLAIGLGKAADVLGGGGQGMTTGGPLALAFTGPGPWLSPQPAVGAFPSQLLEAGWALVGILPLLILASGQVQGRLPLRLRQSGAWLAQRAARGSEVEPGRLRFGFRYLAALAWWLVGRTLVGFTWQDPAVIGGLRMEQLAALATLAGAVLVGAWWSRSG